MVERNERRKKRNGKWDIKGVKRKKERIKDS